MGALIFIVTFTVFIGLIAACIFGYYAYDEGDTDSRWGKYDNDFITPFNQLYDYGQGKRARSQERIERNRIRSEKNYLKYEIRAERKTNKGVKSDG